MYASEGKGLVAVPDPGCSYASCERRSGSAGLDTAWPVGLGRPSGPRSSADAEDPSPLGVDREARLGFWCLSTSLNDA